LRWLAHINQRWNDVFSFREVCDMLRGLQKKVEVAMKRTIWSVLLVVFVNGVLAGAAGVEDLENAIVAKQNEKVEAILKENPGLANPKAKKGGREAPIFFAVMRGNGQALELLIKNGADVNVVNRRGNTPLYELATNVELDLEQMEALLKAGADINGGAYPVLLFAVREGKGELEQFLRKNGARLDVASKDGTTLLHGAAEAGNLRVVKEALEAGIDVNKLDGAGTTALFYAARLRRLEAMKYLIEKGARVNIKAKRMGTPLHAAVWGDSKHVLEAVQLLLANKADPNAVTGYGSVLVDAASKENSKVLRALVEAGGDVNAPANDERWTPLIAAARVSRLENVKYLLEKGADGGKRDRYGYTALDHARKAERENEWKADTVKVLEEDSAARKAKGGEEQGEKPGVDRLAKEVDDKILKRLLAGKAEEAAVPVDKATMERFSALAYRFYMQSLEFDASLHQHMLYRTERDEEAVVSLSYSVETHKVLYEELNVAFPEADGPQKKVAEKLKKARKEVAAALIGAGLKINGERATLTPAAGMRVEAFREGDLKSVYFVRDGKAWKIDVQRSYNTQGPTFEKDHQRIKDMGRALLMTICDLRTGQVDSPEKIEAYVNVMLMAHSLTRESR
jgi:ankyrin repeat protein